GRADRGVPAVLRRLPRHAAHLPVRRDRRPAARHGAGCVPRVADPAAALGRHGLGDGVPQLPARRRAVRLRLRAPPGRGRLPVVREQRVLLARRHRPGLLHRGVRVRGGALGHQLGAVRAGRGRPGRRADVHPDPERRRAAPGAAHRRPAAGQRDHRDDQELGDRGRRRRHRRAVLGGGEPHRDRLLVAVQPDRRRRRLPGHHHPRRHRAGRHRAEDRGQAV
ncbi:MAG: ABC transporter, permease protein (cluster 3, basic aa/glutamine/opines), partial [uncultured Pseudonocardia sp.]